MRLAPTRGPATPTARGGRRGTNGSGLVIIGLIAGALGRLVPPGTSGLSILATMLIGMGGSRMGGTLGSMIAGEAGVRRGRADRRRPRLVILLFVLRRTGRI